MPPVVVGRRRLGQLCQCLSTRFSESRPALGAARSLSAAAWSEIAIVQVLKHRIDGHLSVVRRMVQGSAQQGAQLLPASQGRGNINTAFSERLKATFRPRLAGLARRSRNWARQPETWQAGSLWSAVSTTFVPITTGSGSLSIGPKPVNAAYNALPLWLLV